MSVDAYLGLVEVYIRTGEFDVALEYAKKGYEATGDERLKEKIDMIESRNITDSNGRTMKMSYYDGEGVLQYYATYRYGVYNAAGISLYNADYSECEYDSEGKIIAARYYDVKGNLTSEKRFPADKSNIKYILSGIEKEKILRERRRHSMEEVKVKENEKKEKTGTLKPMYWAIIGTVAVLIVLAGAMTFIFGGSSAEKLQKQLDLGQKYLEEMNYEEAAVAFQAAIEIDPMSVDAYLGLVEVYIRTGEFDVALEYAKKGYEATGDERLKEKIDMIESGNITDSNGRTMKVSHYDGEGVLQYYATYRYGVYNVAGISLYNADGSLLGEGEYQYDEEERMTVEWKIGQRIDGDGKRIELAKSEYEYDSEGNLIVCRYYDGDGTLDYYLEYEHDLEGNLIAHRYYNSDGTLTNYKEFEYDSEGRKIAERYYDGDGTLDGYSEWEYDSEGNLIVCRDYDGDGTLDYYLEYEHDLEGNLIVCRDYNSDGTLRWDAEYEYDSDGNMIACREYDGNGNLMSETKYE